MNSRFKTFRLIDALTFGLVAFIITAIVVFVSIKDPHMPLEPRALFYTVAASSWFIYGSFVYYRYKLLKRITFITKHGIGVITNNFNVDKDNFELIVDNTVINWVSATNCFDCEKSLDGFCVIFEQYPVKHHSIKGNLAGYMIGDNAVVGYNEDLNKTALGHELGHRIHAEWSGYADMEESHQFMSDNNLN